MISILIFYGGHLNFAYALGCPYSEDGAIFGEVSAEVRDLGMHGRGPGREESNARGLDHVPHLHR